MPKVSVLMPVYKTQKEYLKEAIESILNQTFTDFEFLILDDCPDDSREDIVTSYKDKRIVYQKNEHNLGVSASRNKLLDMAKGEYIAVFDHDDISDPQRLEKQFSYMEAHPEIGVLGSQIQKLSNKKVSKLPLETHEIKVALMGYCAIAHTTAIIRREVLTKNNIRYKEEYSPCEDYALWGDLIEHTEFHNLEDVLLEYRDYAGNTTHKQEQKMQNKGAEVCAKLRSKHSDLYFEFKMSIPHIEYVRLLGVIPFLKIVRIGVKTKIYLFEKILILSNKLVTKL